MNRICNKPCPIHGDKCKVAEGSKDDKEMAMRLFGAKMKFKGHVHLCLADPNKPHTWED